MMFKNMRTYVQLIVTAAMIASLFSCSRTDQKPLRPPEKVTIAFSAKADAVLAEVAQTKGYFLFEGLKVMPHLHPYGKLALKEVLEGKADFATVAETPCMFAIMKGEMISIVATIQRSGKNGVIVARKDKGILTPSDLRGRKIAATLGTTSDFYLDAFLAAHGISRKEITVVDLKAEEAPAALANGVVEAASLFSPYSIEARKNLAARGATFIDKELYTFTFNIVARQEFIRKNPETVNKLLRALLKAEEFTHQNPEDAQRIVADFSRMDLETVREIWAVTNFDVSLDQGLVLALEDESRWAVKNKMVGATDIPNYLDYIYLDGLRAVKPDAVRILR